MAGANTVRVGTIEVEAVIIVGATLMACRIKIILHSGTDLEVVIVMEDKKEAKEAVVVMDLAMVMEDKEVITEDTKVQGISMVDMIFLTKELAKETTAAKVTVMKGRTKVMEADQ